MRKKPSTLMGGAGHLKSDKASTDLEQRDELVRTLQGVKAAEEYRLSTVTNMSTTVALPDQQRGMSISGSVMALCGWRFS